MNTKVRLGLAAVVIVGVVGYHILFVDDAEVLRFNDTLVEYSNRAVRSDEAFFKELEKYTDGQQVNVQILEKRRDSFAKSAARNRGEINKMAVPDCEFCRRFHASVLKFIDGKIRIAEGLKGVVQIVEANNPGGEVETAKIGSLIGTLLIQDEQLYTVVGNEQQNLAREYGLKMKK